MHLQLFQLQRRQGAAGLFVKSPSDYPTLDCTVLTLIIGSEDESSVRCLQKNVILVLGVRRLNTYISVHARTHARTHAHTHTRTHTQYRNFDDSRYLSDTIHCHVITAIGYTCMPRNDIEIKWKTNCSNFASTGKEAAVRNSAGQGKTGGTQPCHAQYRLENLMVISVV